MVSITFALEDGQEVIVPLTDRLTLGRGEDNDVVVNDERLSPRHAEILPHPCGSFEVRDLGSTTGTFVNDQRVESCRLLQGDRLAFGPLTAVLDLAPHASVSGSADEAASSAETLAAAEKRLTQWQAAARQAEAAHEQWLAAIAGLTQQHEEKTAAFKQLGDDITAARLQLTELANRQQQETTHLGTLQSDAAKVQTRLTDLRQELGELESQLHAGHTLLTTQNEQISTAEQTLSQLEQRRTEFEASLQTLNQSEEKLAQSQERLQSAETQHSTLTAAIARLAQDQQQRETSLQQLQSDLQSTEASLTIRRGELATQARLLEQTQCRLTELEKQCQALSAQQRAKPTPPSPKPAPPPASTSTDQRGPRIVAIDAPRYTVIPMKSEHVVKRSGETPPRKGT